MPWGYRPTRGVKYKRRVSASDLAKAVGLKPDTVLRMARDGRLPSRREKNRDVTFPLRAVWELVKMGHHLKL